MSENSLLCWRKNSTRSTISRNLRLFFYRNSKAFCLHTHQPEQTSELSRRIREAEKDVQRLVTEDFPTDGSHEHEHTSSPTDPESQQHDPYGQDGGSDDDSDDEDGGHTESESFDALEDRVHDLEEEVATLVADVHDLALYTKLNITGFMKILKVRLSPLYLSCSRFKNIILPET